MPAWGWVIIVVVIAIAIAGIAWAWAFQRRTARLKSRFGLEYDRAADRAGSRRGGESDLIDRQEHRERFEVRPLTPEARERYVESWRVVQSRFVDQPSQAVEQADALVIDVMRDRGYPMEDFDRRSRDVSVDYPHVVENYRAAHAISMANDHGQVSTEDLRQAIVYYRALFEELLGSARTDADRRVG